MAKTDVAEARDNLEMAALERLERRVETAARVIHELRAERDELLRDRAMVTQRVESILERLEATGLD